MIKITVIGKGRHGVDTTSTYSVESVDKLTDKETRRVLLSMGRVFVDIQDIRILLNDNLAMTFTTLPLVDRDAANTTWIVTDLVHFQVTDLKRSNVKKPIGSDIDFGLEVLAAVIHFVNIYGGIKNGN